MSEALAPSWPPKGGAHRRDQLALARAAMAKVTEELGDDLTAEEVGIRLARTIARAVALRRAARAGVTTPTPVILDRVMQEIRPWS